MTALEFEQFIRNGMTVDIEDFFNDIQYEGDDAEGYEDEFYDLLWDALHEEFIVRAGVEKFCVFQKNWDKVFKFQVQIVGTDETDFMNACELADEAGFGDLFLSETRLDTRLPVRVISQPKYTGNIADCLTQERRTLRSQLSKKANDSISWSYSENLLTWVFSLYGEDFGFKFQNFLEENCIRDLHECNFAVGANYVEIFDCIIYA